MQNGHQEYKKSGVEPRVKRVVSLLFVLLWGAQVHAEFNLSPPPSLGSSQDQVDYQKVREVQQTRSEADCADAVQHASMNIQDWFGQNLPGNRTRAALTRGELSYVRPLALKVVGMVGVHVGLQKEKFKRPRPFVTHSDLRPCIPRASGYSYPSGHAAVGYALGIAFARVFPEKAEVLLSLGLGVGDYRVLGGVHYPSDVAAGRELATQIILLNLKTSVRGLLPIALDRGSSILDFLTEELR